MMTSKTVRLLALTLGLALLAGAGLVLAERLAARSSAPDALDTAALGPLVGSAGPLAVRADLAQTAILQGGDGLFSLRLTLTAAEAEAEAANVHRPVDLVLVLDRSGSMEGEKLADAKRAVLGLLDSMGPEDSLALVTYAHEVTAHGPLTRADAAGKAALAAVLEGVEAGGNTNLGGGLAAGLDILSRAEDGHARRLVLLSDGLANAGLTDPEALGVLAGRAMDKGAALSTVGVGLDFNEQLMSSLADHGGGEYTFLEDPEHLAEAFVRELREARGLAATAVEVSLPLPEGVRLEYAAGYPIETHVLNGRTTATIRPGGVRAGKSRELFLTFRAPVDRPGRIDLADLGVAGQVETPWGLQHFWAKVPGSLSVVCTADGREVARSVDRTVWEAQTLRQDYNRLKDEVALAVKAGDLDQAMARIDDYKLAKAEANKAVGSARVAQNLDEEVEALRGEAAKALSPEAAPLEQERFAKGVQAQSWQEQRSK